MQEKLGIKTICDLIDKEIKRRFKIRNLTNEQISFAHICMLIITLLVIGRISEVAEFRNILKFNQYDDD